MGALSHDEALHDGGNEKFTLSSRKASMNVKGLFARLRHIGAVSIAVSKEILPEWNPSEMH